jgi:hypothetical protein
MTSAEQRPLFRFRPVKLMATELQVPGEYARRRVETPSPRLVGSALHVLQGGLRDLLSESRRRSACAWGRRIMITADAFHSYVDQCRAAGYGEDIDWAESIKPPANPMRFAREMIYVICNSGMRFTVARGIFDRVMVALERGDSASTAFGHRGKSDAIDFVWQNRQRLWIEYLSAADPLAFCADLPWIGGITKYHLAKNFGAQVAKPDVHLQRLADAEGCSAQELCERLAADTGYKVPTVDTVLWRACAIGIIRSREIEAPPR